MAQAFMQVVSEPCVMCSRPTSSVYYNRIEGESGEHLCQKCAHSITEQHLKYALDNFTTIIKQGD